MKGQTLGHVYRPRRRNQQRGQAEGAREQTSLTKQVLRSWTRSTRGRKAPFHQDWEAGARGDGRCGPRTSSGPHEGQGRGGQRPGWVRTMDLVTGADKRKATKTGLPMKEFGSKMASKIK